MTIFTITPENIITAHATQVEANSIPEPQQFGGAKELGILAAQWPASRLLEIWNSLPGPKRVNRFTDPKTTVSRIWTAIQNLAPEAAAQAAAVGPKKAKPGKQATQLAKPATARHATKAAQVLQLVKRPGGEALEKLTTNWPAQTARGFGAGTLRKKMGLTIVFGTGHDGKRAYWIN